MAGTTQNNWHFPAFDEPFAFSIKHIQVIPDVNSAGLAFQSGRWKPPTRKDGVRLIQGIRYNSAPQSAKFLWRPILNDAVTMLPANDEHFYRPHKSTTLFWATDSGTFMHVPYDCTQRDVEDPTQDDSETEEDDDEDDDAGIELEAYSLSQPPPQSSRIPETWRRLRFNLHYPPSQPPQHPSLQNAHQLPAEPPAISRVCYDGGHFVSGNLPSRLRNTLIPSVHKHPEIHYTNDCLLAGDLSTLLGLVAFCHPENDRAVHTIASWFPPSRRTTRWDGPTNAGSNHSMQTCDQRSRRGMVIETFYDSRRGPNAQSRLESWENGNLPIIT